MCAWLEDAHDWAFYFFNGELDVAESFFRPLLEVGRFIVRLG
jgi:hypothetical protein